MKNLRLLEFAVALERHRSFARAAESMRVTQPTLSRGIATLESDLGARLFDRSTRRVQPTAVGRAFLERAEALLHQASRLSELTGDHDGSLTGNLVVGAGPYALECSVLSAVARLARLHPALRIRIVEGAWRDLPGALLGGTLDLVVMEASVLVDDHRLMVEALPRHRGCLVCRADHPLAQRKGIAFEDLEPYPLVGVPMTRDIGPAMGRTTRLMDVDYVSGDLKPHIVTTSLHAMIELVLLTDGVGLYPTSLLRDHRRAHQLAVLDTRLDLPSTGYGIATAINGTPSPAVLAFMQVLREVEHEKINGQATAAATGRPRMRRRR
jgi:DNA-binding transcriptional LysR family regulator